MFYSNSTHFYTLTWYSYLRSVWDSKHILHKTKQYMTSNYILKLYLKIISSCYFYWETFMSKYFGANYFHKCLFIGPDLMNCTHDSFWACEFIATEPICKVIEVINSAEKCLQHSVLHVFTFYCTNGATAMSRVQTIGTELLSGMTVTSSHLWIKHLPSHIEKVLKVVCIWKRSL